MEKDEYFKKLEGVVQPPKKVDDPSKEEVSDERLKAIHTFKSDIADAIKKEGISYATIATAEVERQKKMDRAVEPHSKKVKNFFGILVSTFLLILGIGVVFTAIIFFKKPTPQFSKVTQTGKKEFSSDFQSVIHISNFDKQSIVSSINSEKLKSLPQGNIKVVTLSASVGTTSITLPIVSLVSVIAPNLSGQTARSLQGNYQLGFYGQMNSNSVFLLFHTDSYDDAYGGMLDWEKYMVQDLNGFLILPRTVTSTSTASLVTPTTTATSTSTAATSTTVTTIKIIPLNNHFQDEVVGNKDVRVLKDAGGNTIFLYSFLDQQTLVLTTSENALLEIENRIISAQRVQ